MALLIGSSRDRLLHGLLFKEAAAGSSQEAGGQTEERELL